MYYIAICEICGCEKVFVSLQRISQIIANRIFALHLCDTQKYRSFLPLLRESHISVQLITNAKYRIVKNIIMDGREKLIKIQEETGHMYNLEATPAEGATTRFAREDKKRFVDIIQAGTKENPFYTNSSQLPVGYTDDPFEALDLQSTLQTKYTGGTVLHLYMGQRISSAKVCRDIVKRVLTNYRLPYITITPTFSICPKHGYISGEHKYCPICDEEKKAAKRAAASRKDVA